MTPDKYKEIGGTFFHIDTLDRVCQILNDAMRNRNRIRIFYGSDGRIWSDEYDIIGRVGRSGGTIKIPLMVFNERSFGGGGILDHRIVRIQDVKTKQVLYMADGYTLPEFEIREADADLQSKGYSTSVFGKLHGNVANFKTRKQAENWIAFMRGERMAK